MNTELDTGGSSADVMDPDDAPRSDFAVVPPLPVRDVILDTDIGDDIDDAFALALLLAVRGVRLRGVTTVYSEVHKRARIAARLLSAARRTDIPVAAGLPDPLRNRTQQNDWVDAQLRAVPVSEQFAGIQPVTGPELIGQLLRESEATVTLVAIGPLTNIAAVLTNYPELRSRIHEIVVMGGYFAEQVPSWNTGLDPEAAAVVYASGLAVRIVPLDVTRTCVMHDGLLDAMMRHGGAVQVLLGELLAGWKEHSGTPNPLLHDPIAVACLVIPEIFSFHRYDVEVVLEAGTRYGVTLASRNDMSPIQICDAVDYSQFIRFFAAHILGTETILELM